MEALRRLCGTSKKLPGAPKTCSANSPTCRRNPAHSSSIPAAELPRIFERGYRASNVVGRFHGTGLGLAGVHHIATEHGGTMVVESQIGIGTTATVRLPLEVSPR